MVTDRDRKLWGDKKCEKHRFSYTLYVIFDRLSHHIGFLNLARLFGRVRKSGSPISGLISMVAPDISYPLYAIEPISL